MLADELGTCSVVQTEALWYDARSLVDAAKALMARLGEFLDGFAGCLVRKPQIGHATRYVQGLLSDAKSKNMEGMISRLSEPGDYQSLQHFITHSTYCGALGKIANCQVVVTSALRTEKHMWPVAMEIYLPETWCEDEERRSQANVPASNKHRTKIEMAVEQIDTAIRSGLKIRCVLADAGYGESTDFRKAIAARRLCYAVGVGKSVTVFTRPPQFVADGRPSRPKLARGSARSQSLEEVADAAKSSEWRRITWRRGTKGKLAADFLLRRVRPAHRWDRGERHEEVWLICERSLGHESVRKFYLSNLPANIAHQELVRITHERWAIEMQYRDLKQEIGLDHFEGRSYPGFERHLALTSLAYHFLQTERRRSRKKPIPSLNAVRRGVTEILTAMLFTLGERFAKLVSGFARSPPKA